MKAILPVILSGGAGTRLWPLSTNSQPKQFHRLVDAHSLLQATALRFADANLFAAPLIIANEAHAGAVEAQLEEVGVASAGLILEPLARNTAPAIALAALLVAPDDLLLVLPSDHVIRDIAGFHAAIRSAAPLAEDGWLVTFGIRPDRPETGYGYIKRGEALGPDAFTAERFVEKPDLATAEAYLTDGGYDWNGGIFLMRADRYLAELAAQAPDILEPVRAAMDQAQRENRRIIPAAAEFAAARAQSIDYAVMEGAQRVGVVPVAIGWSDIGSWDALHDLADKDEAGTAAAERTIAIDSANCLIRSEGPTVVTVGVRDLIVIATPDAVLVLPRGESQRAKEAAEAAEARPA